MLSKRWQQQPVALLTLAFSVAVMGMMQPSFANQEAKLHPSLIPVKDVANLPRVLLIGDSISMGYTLAVRQELAAQANVHRPPVNCHHSRQILDEIEGYLGSGNWDVIHFNCGIHDLTRWKVGEAKPSADGTPKVPLDEYRRNLARLVVRLHATGAKLIWATTTPVTADYKGKGYRRSDDIEAYNQAAREVMQRYQVDVNDLHGILKPDMATYAKDGLHLHDAGYQFVAKQVANTIVQSLKKSPNANADMLHQAAVNRRRRLIYNNDGAEPAVLMKTATQDEFLKFRTDPLIDSNVDSIFYCPRTSGFSVVTYRTKIGQPFDLQSGRYESNQTLALHAKGMDPLQLTIDFGHRHGREVFCSMRMNDTHDAHINNYGKELFGRNKFKTSHPELLLGEYNKKLKHGAWSAVNYARPEVRELAYRMLEELCLYYDLDGIELDFFRHPCFFPSTTRGQPATSTEKNQMTELIERVRTMTRQISKRRRRPILIAIHTPDSLPYCQAMGLDLEHWMSKKYFDLWIAGGTFRLNPWQQSVAIGHKFGIKVYPSLDDPRVKDDLAKAMRAEPVTYRARALEAWNAGADGINLFNFHDMPAQNVRLLKELADSSLLAQGEQRWFVSFQGLVNSAAGNYPHESFLTLPLLNQSRPTPIRASMTVEKPITVVTSSKLGSKFSARLRLRFEPAASAGYSILWNNQLLAGGTVDGQWLNFEISPDSIGSGRNLISVKNGSATTIRWIDACLDCTPHTSN